MRQGAALLLSIFLIFSCAACGRTAEAKSGKEKEDAVPPFPGTAVERTGTEKGQPEPAASDAAGKGNLYDPSIFVVEASGSWRQELAPGYYANYECELYIDKFDANDNRSASGLYTGVFWMKVTVEVADYLKDLLKDTPVEMDFAAGGEGVCDNLTMYLLNGYERDPFGDYAIPDGQDGFVEPEKETLAGEGGILVTGTQAYLDARAHGASGEGFSHQDGQTGDAELGYVVHIEPDPGHQATERRVTIYLSGAQGMSATLAGVWRRLPGYRDDMLDYANAGKSAQVLERHLK